MKLRRAFRVIEPKVRLNGGAVLRLP